MITITQLAAELGTDAEALIGFSGINSTNPGSEISDHVANVIRDIWASTSEDGVHATPEFSAKIALAAIGQC